MFVGGRPDRPARQERAPLSLREAEAMLAYIDGAEDRETWIAVGMALKAEFGDGAFDAWDRWASSAANYDPKACRASWRGFKSRAGGYSVGTVIKLARDGGYRAEPGQRPAPDELAKRRAERAEREQRERAERAALAASAQERAVALWRQGSAQGSSPYAQRKGIERPESVRYLPDGGLLIPMLRYDLPRETALKGIQCIAADGTKRFTKGMEKPGAACRLGLPVVGEPVFVCEGWATGMSIRMALERRYPVWVAFDAYNLPLVVELVHDLIPSSPIVICADDDWRTTRPMGDVRIPWNTGRIQAQIAMDGVMDAGAKLVARTAPLFSRGVQRQDGDTDFNDLHRLEGLAAVRAALDVALECISELRAHG